MSVDPTLVARFNTKWAKDDASSCWLWTASKHPRGYGQIKLPRQRRQIPAHRLSYLIHKGEIAPGMHVCHQCDVPACVNPDHLFLGTPADNLGDMKSKGRHVYGEKHGLSKLTEVQVREMLALVKGGMSQRQAAIKFGLGQMEVSRIVRGERWAHVSPDVPKRPRRERSKITDEQVADIRKLSQTGMPQTKIASFFGISQTQVGRIIRRERWASVE